VLAFRAKRGGRRVGREARPAPEAGPVVRAIGIVVKQASGTGTRERVLPSP